MNELNALNFLPHPQVIAIDNNKKELDLIVAGLLDVGLPTIPLLYDTMAGMQIPQIWDPNRIRIIFLDLNLCDIENAGGSIGALTGPIRDVLISLSPTGPFIIAFWTKHNKLVEQVMAHMVAGEGGRDVPLPMRYVIIDKEPFLPINGDHDIEALHTTIASELIKNELFLSLTAWESEIEKAAARTINRLSELAKEPQANGTSLCENDLIDILKNMAIQAWGRKNAKQNPGGAVTRGLAPLLVDHVDQIVGDESYSQVWKKALTGGWNRALPERVQPAMLNSHCLVDLNCSNSNLRGAWFAFTETALRRPSIWRKHFGTTKDKLIDEFINIDTSAEGKKARKLVRLGLLECTAACDFVNNKAPLLRYILCAMIPARECAKFICWSNPDRGRKHDAICQIESILVDDKEYSLHLNFKYVLSLAPENDLLKQELASFAFRVRNQVLHDITIKYAGHTTRPGIYSFQTKPGT